MQKLTQNGLSKKKQNQQQKKLEYSVTSKFLENCIGESLQALGLFEEFFDVTPKTQPRKEKNQWVGFLSNLLPSCKGFISRIFKEFS